MAGRKDLSTAGSATVELALIVPVLVLVMLGVLDLGRVFYRAITVANAARAGVAFGSVNPTNAADIAGMEAAAAADAQDVTGLTISAARYCECGTLSPTSIDCTAAACADSSPPRIYVQVTVAGTFTPTVPYPGLPELITITRVAHMRAQ